MHDFSVGSSLVAHAETPLASPCASTVRRIDSILACTSQGGGFGGFGGFEEVLFPGARVYRRAPPRRQSAQQAQAQPQDAMLEMALRLVLMLPLIMMVGNWLFGSSALPYGFKATTRLPEQMRTSRGVTYYVGSREKFYEAYPAYSSRLGQKEREIDEEYLTILNSDCTVQVNSVARKVSAGWDIEKAANSTPLGPCQEMCDLYNRCHKVLNYVVPKVTVDGSTPANSRAN